MKAVVENGRVIGVELTRRNLQGLLAKLDGNPPGSRCTLEDRTGVVYVKAVENEAHYADRAPGIMHADTELKVD